MMKKIWMLMFWAAMALLPGLGHGAPAAGVNGELPWMIQHDFFDVWVVRVPAAAPGSTPDRVSATVVESLRGQAPRETLELTLASAPKEQARLVLKGGDFLVFALSRPDGAGSEAAVAAALPAKGELIEAARSVIPEAHKIQSLSRALFLCLAIIPGLCVGAQVKIRRLPREADARRARALAWSGFSLCVAYGIVALAYVWVAPSLLPAPRIDLIAMLPFFLYCVGVSFEFLETWTTGVIRGRE